MNEATHSDPNATAVLGGSAAFRVGAVLLVGLALSLGLAATDRQRRASIESWQEVTAVGDKPYFVPPSDPASEAMVVMEAGQFKILTAERTKLKDTQMRRAGRDAVTGVHIYQTEPPQTPVRFYVRVAPGEYLPAIPAAP